MSEKSGEQDNERLRHGRWRNDQRIRNKIEQLRRIQFGQRGFLRPQIMQLFEQGPMSGVDIMDKLQQESHGWYRPSPGSIYPLLSQLEREGLISKNPEGKFELTSAYADQKGVGDDIAGALSSMESNVSYLEDLQRSDAGRVARSKDRIDRLAKRLGELEGRLAPRNGS